MTTEVIYIANDGKKFHDEEECYAYEKDLEFKAIADSILLFDDEGQELPLNDNGLADAYFIISKSAKASEIAWQVFGSYDNPFESAMAGMWVYFADHWYPADDIISMAEIATAFKTKFDVK